MKRYTKFTIFPVLFLISGCWAAVVGGVAGAGAVVYNQGQLVSHEGTTYEQSLKAVFKALDDLGYKVENTEKGVAKEKVTAVTPDSTKIHITVKYKSKEHTEITIRVGVFGDEELSREVLRQIRKYLY